ncbi:DeoR/GlpR family DNA-binding transcription regulator [Klebsiella pneumoniae]|nr:DeoR/GlpR family DNA-binding transcription regulator [Klebsiella pneumoniae]
MQPNASRKRRSNLAQLLVTEGAIKVGVLAERFGVSTETIRKDLLELEKQGVIQKRHGKAVPFNSLLELERPFERKVAEHTDAKSRIAQAALELIPDEGVIILDAGSTNFLLAKLLFLHEGLTIFTNSLNCAQALLNSKNEVYLLGGKLRGISLASVGAWGVNNLEGIRADIAFVGADGFNSSSGPCTASYEEAELKKHMVRRSQTSVVLSDSSKFELTGLFKYCEWTEVDYLITDTGVRESDIETLSQSVTIIKA